MASLFAASAYAQDAAKGKGMTFHGEKVEGCVLVQREMESGLAPLASITPIQRGQFAPPEAWPPGGRVPGGRNRNWFHKKGNQARVPFTAGRAP